MKIRNLHHLQRVLAAGPYAWPGGYPLYFVMADCEPMSFEAVAVNKGEVFAAFEEGGDDAWRPVFVQINWESTDLYCAHTGMQIEAAYVEEENA